MKNQNSQPPSAIQRTILRLMAGGVALLAFGCLTAEAQNITGADGGLEGSATIDNTTLATAGAAGKWQKANATQTIALETTVVRSGDKSLKILNNSSNTMKRVYSPLLASVADGSRLVIQYYRRVPTGTGQQNDVGLYFGDTTGEKPTSFSYNAPASADTWEKQTYVSTATTTSGNKWAVIVHKLISAGDDTLPEYIDDLAVYVGTAVDTATPNSATSPTISSATASQLTVSWTASTGDAGANQSGLQGYLVVRGTSDPTTVPNVNGIYAVGNTVAAGQTVVFVGTAAAFNDTGLTAGTQYYYRIYAYDNAYNYATAATANGSTTYGEVAQYPLGNSFTGWPADSDWHVLSGLNDANNGANQLFDFVGDTSNPCGYWATNSSYVFFRMRVQTNSVSATTYNGLGTLWVYIDTNADNQADCSFAWDKRSNDDANHGLECQKFNTCTNATWNDLVMKDVDGNEENKGTKDPSDINGLGRTGDGYVRSVDGQPTVNFGTTTFIDFAVSWAYLRDHSQTGLNTGQTWRIAFGSGNERLDYQPPNLDIAGGASTSSSTSDGWSDPFATPVVLLQLQALTQNGQVTVRWSTSSEMNTAGFDLYRLTDGQWVKLNAALIPAQGWPNGGIGASYSVVDPGAQPGQTYSYKLVERTTDGQSIEYGPYERTVSEFAVKNFEMTPEGFKLKWLSRAGEKYRVLKRTDLRTGQYLPIAENLDATPPENEYVDPVTTGAAFYRIELQP